ncbi:MAG: response regulator [Candidatus Woesearchaeota archaeon]
MTHKALTVLVAEDYDPNREAVVEIIKQSLDNATIIEAATGAAALEALLQCMPAMALLDFNMPYMNGSEVILQFRTRRPNANTLFLLYSANHSNKEYAEQLGVPFLSKPCDINQLRAYVRRLAEEM